MMLMLLIDCRNVLNRESKLVYREKGLSLEIVPCEYMYIQFDNNIINATCQTCVLPCANWQDTIANPKCLGGQPPAGGQHFLLKCMQVAQLIVLL